MHRALLLSRCLATALASAWLAVASSARAGNDDGILLGNEAALTGGAITAVVSDGSALWYNPAGLAQARRYDTLDVSASAYGLRSYRMPGLLSATDGSSADAKFTEVVSVPSAVTYVRQLNKRLTASLGLFTPQSNDYTLRTSLTTSSGALVTRWQVGLAARQTQYHAGGGVALELVPGVMLGVSLLGAYQSAFSSQQVAGSAEDSAGTVYGFAVHSQIEQATVLGLYADVGLLVRASERFSFGVSVRGPGMTVFRSQRITSVDGSTAPDDNGQAVSQFEPKDSSTREADISLFAPLRVRMGVAYAFVPGGYVSLDGDVQSKLTNRALGVDRVLTWNLRLGGLLPFRDHYAFGAGVFTDRGPEKADANGAGPVDFYGFSAGLQYWNARKLDPSEPQQRLTFSTTVGVRYAHGNGKFQSARFDAETAEVSYPAAHVKVDEVSLQLGSALHF